MDIKAFSFKQVIEILEKEGRSEDEISQILEDLVKTASTRFYAEAMAVFSDEDMREIEEAATDEAANVIIARKFQEKTGADANAAMQKFLDTFAQGFIDQYNKDKSGNPTQS